MPEAYLLVRLVLKNLFLKNESLFFKIAISKMKVKNSVIAMILISENCRL